MKGFGHAGGAAPRRPWTTPGSTRRAPVCWKRSRSLQRSRERFFATVNHELRNALAAIYGWAEMLVRKKDPATVPRAAYEVLESAGQAVALINDLLDLSRLDEDRLKPVIRAGGPAVLARRALEPGASRSRRETGHR